MDETVIDQKYTDFIEELIKQISPMLPEDVNELQKNYLITNIRRSANLMATSIMENKEFDILEFDEQCFYIQIIMEWSFHKEIDLFRSGIPAKYWKNVMQKIWYTTWEVMFACVKNNAPRPAVLSLVERFVNRSYQDAVEELKDLDIIDDKTELQAKNQSNITTMAAEVMSSNLKRSYIKKFILYLAVLLIVIAPIVTYIIIRFKSKGIIFILSMIIFYLLFPAKNQTTGLR